MRIQYLGTAAAEGWPAVFCGCDACRRARALGGRDLRTRSQALIDGQLLIDLPPDTYLHALRDGLELGRIASLLITHSHQDHFYPYELFLRGDPYARAPAAPLLTVYGGERVRTMYEMALPYNDSPNLCQRVRFCQVFPFQPFTTAEGYRITPLRARHARDEECLLYLIEKDGKRLFYANDSGMYPPETWEYLQGRHLDLVSFDCTYVCSADGTYHMGLPDNREARKLLWQRGCADETTRYVVTHFSHGGKLSHSEIQREAGRDGFTAAYDGMEVEL